MCDVEAALRAAIAAAPADDGRRLVFADWLDENATADSRCPDCDPGNPGWRWLGTDRMKWLHCLTCKGVGRIGGNGFAERAEFIRVQVELERFPYCKNVRERDYDASDGVSPDWQRAFDLQRREAELLDQNAAQWLSIPGLEAVGYGLPNLTRALLDGSLITFDWVKGFVHTIRGTLAQLIGGPCERCEGRPGYVSPPGGLTLHPCPACHGTGSRPGAGAVVRSQPVERVEVTDREPWQVMNGPHVGKWHWVSGLAVSRPWHLPIDVDDTLRAIGCGSPYQCPIFDTADAAMSALGLAVLAHLRRNDDTPG